MHHLLLRLVHLIADHYGQSHSWDKSSNKGQIHETHSGWSPLCNPLTRGRFLRPDVVKVLCVWQSPPTRVWFLWPSVVEVRCMWQSPPMRGRLMRPTVIKVCCTWQSFPTRGNFLKPIVAKVHCKWQSLATMGRILSPFWPKALPVRQRPPMGGRSPHHCCQPSVLVSCACLEH